MNMGASDSVTLLFISFLFIFDFSTSQEDLVVSTNSGRVLGKIAKDKNGNNFYSFRSIPYAQPPIETLRFQAPVPVEPWKGILDATKSPPPCPQDFSLGKEVVVIGQEDCLRINVYTPSLPNTNNSENVLLPVMVNIHGGGFRLGTSGIYGPEFLLTEKVVLVTFNYRLGILGFLSFDNETLGVPGNAGMKDQVLALKWVKDNIKYFGGNPNDVTLLGESAGSASVHMHVLSPMSKGLFHKAIAQSGSALNLWATGKQDNGKILAQILNITATDESNLLEKLKMYPMKELVKAQAEMLKGDINKKRNCSVVEEYQKNQPAFLPASPSKILKSGNFSKVPFMLGYNSQEGMLMQLESYLSTGNVSIIENYESYIPYNLPNDTNTVKDLAKKIDKFYNQNNTHNSTLVLQPTINFVTDSNFYYHIYQTAIEHAKSMKEPVYFYRFSADTKLNILKRPVPALIPYPGAAHGDDVAYLFKILLTPEPGTIEELSVNRAVRLWTNFAKYGNPTPSKDALLNNEIWKPFQPDDVYVFEFGNSINASSNPDIGRYMFWKNIYDSYPMKTEQDNSI